MNDAGALGIPGLADASEIGRGGFAVVYRARQVRFDRLVAVKVIDRMVDDDVQRRFERECLAVGALSDHPNIVTVYDAGLTASGQPYLLMELAIGGSFAHRLATSGVVPWAEMLSVGVRLAGALEAAHRSGRIHRDIKPDNVLIDARGEPMLADFGVAVVQDASATPTASASIAYAAPELLENKPSSPATDVYELAATLFALVNGAAPYAKPGDAIATVVARIGRDPIPDLRPNGIPDAVCAALEAGLAKDPQDRPSTAAAFGELLRDAQRATGQVLTSMVVVELPDGNAAPRIPREDRAEHTRPVRRPGEASVSAQRGEDAPPAEQDVFEPWYRNRIITGSAAGALVLLVAVVLIGVSRGGHAAPKKKATPAAPHEPATTQRPTTTSTATTTTGPFDRPAVRRLLTHVPLRVKGDAQASSCAEAAGAQGSIAAVKCRIAGANVLLYSLFPDKTSLEAFYAKRFREVRASYDAGTFNGKCSKTSPFGESNYTGVDGHTVGRLLCWQFPAAGGTPATQAWLEWNHPGSLIYADMGARGGSISSLLDIWDIAGPT